LRWLHDTSQISADNLHIVVGETNRHFGKKKYEGKFESYINNFKTNSENRNVGNLYRGFKKLRKCYQPRAK
jgi:hypothetical protein